jgi:hypothetical protein
MTIIKNSAWVNVQIEVLQLQKGSGLWVREEIRME